jgi:alkylated DNA repair protein (DNA oxidative demethylase)
MTGGQQRFAFAAGPEREQFAPGAWLLRGFARQVATDLLAGIHAIAHVAPFRRMRTPGGRSMSVAMTNCGACGWVSDAGGYRYSSIDPETGAMWPAMPASFVEMAAAAAFAAGYDGFAPDACLVNRYEADSRMALHQDRDERDLAQPIVSVSLGLPAVFVFGGMVRNAPTQRLPLEHGDVVVWGGPSRLCFHGVQPVKDGEHPATGRARFNLTFRAAR